MIQIKIEIEENGVNITITTPLGKKLQFRSTAENNEIFKKAKDDLKSGIPIMITAEPKKDLEKIKTDSSDSLKKRKPQVFKKKKICKNCQMEFLPTSARQEFCTTHCKEIYKQEKKDTDELIEKTEKLPDELKQETKKSDVEKEVKKIADEHPELKTFKRLCKICGSIFTTKDPDQKDCDRCKQNP